MHIASTVFHTGSDDGGNGLGTRLGPGPISLNTLTDEAVYRRHEISSVMSDFRQCPWEIGQQRGRGRGRWVGAPEGCRQHGGVWA